MICFLSCQCDFCLSFCGYLIVYFALIYLIDSCVTRYILMF